MIYLVTDGEYEDYRIVAVCTTPEKAAYAKSLFSADNIEEWQEDELPPHPIGKKIYEVCMRRDGEVDWIRTEVFYPDSHIFLSCDGDPDKIAAVYDFWSYGESDCMQFWMWAGDEDEAVAFADEKRKMLIEMGKWGTDRRFLGA